MMQLHVLFICCALATPLPSVLSLRSPAFIGNVSPTRGCTLGTVSKSKSLLAAVRDAEAHLREAEGKWEELKPKEKAVDGANDEVSKNVAII